MVFEIRPYIGAGTVLLGMTSEQIKCVMGVLPRKFKRFEDEEYTDEYAGFFVYYKANGKCEAIEFFEPSSILFKGHYIINRPYIEVKNFFKDIDSSIEMNDAGFTSVKYGIGVYAPYADDEPYEPVESVIIFEQGYYD